jgi:hypothetical protein
MSGSRANLKIDLAAPDILPAGGNNREPGPTNQVKKSGVSTPHKIMPPSSTAQSVGVNPNSLPSLATNAIIAGARCLDPAAPYSVTAMVAVARQSQNDSIGL